MPELPEVEIVARSLNSLVSGRGILSATLLRHRLAPDSTPKKFARELGDATINFIHRRGKHVLFDLSNGRTLITHLRMSGKFRLLDAEAENPKFTHALFELDDASKLLFQDQRHFGLMKVVATSKLAQAKEIEKLAPEPLSDEFTVDYLRRALKSTSRTLKEVLLDQTKVCGLGNIYAAEAMFLARSNPTIPAHKLSKPRTVVLFDAIRQVLSDAVELGSVLPVIPDDIGGSIYGNGSDWEWRVYDRESMPCIECERPIKRIVQGGRSTYFCRKCQAR